MKQYLDICKHVIENGAWKENRTGIRTLFTHGAMAQYDMADGFPAITTKKLAWKSVVAELIGFLRGGTSASDFRKLGTTIWDANANENKEWLDNPIRKGTDDLGRIYGAQHRCWKTNEGVAIDQLSNAVQKLAKRIDDRRLIVTAWNPGELHRMALPPCHLLYQFGVEGDKLNLCMYQRSCDLPLGVPFNISSYALLLHIIAKITDFIPGTFTHFMWDVHIYENQLPLMEEQITRKPMALPSLQISNQIANLQAMEVLATAEDFQLTNYNHHPQILYPFAV